MKRPRRLGLVLFVLLIICAPGCDNAEPAIVGTPTPAPTSTPEPPPFTLSITAQPSEKDLLGKELGDENHYLRYLSLGNLRVYEYENSTLLDAVVVNAYPLPLSGVLTISYFDGDGKLVGRGTLYNAEGTEVFPTGSSAIYAEIATDVDVRLMDFVLDVDRELSPVAEENG